MPDQPVRQAVVVCYTLGIATEEVVDRALADPEAFDPGEDELLADLKEALLAAQALPGCTVGRDAGEILALAQQTLTQSGIETPPVVYRVDYAGPVLPEHAQIDVCKRVALDLAECLDAEALDLLAGTQLKPVPAMPPPPQEGLPSTIDLWPTAHELAEGEWAVRLKGMRRFGAVDLELVGIEPNLLTSAKLLLVLVARRWLDACGEGPLRQEVQSVPLTGGDPRRFTVEPFQDEATGQEVWRLRLEATGLLAGLKTPPLTKELRTYSRMFRELLMAVLKHFYPDVRRKPLDEALRTAQENLAYLRETWEANGSKPDSGYRFFVKSFSPGEVTGKPIWMPLVGVNEELLVAEPPEPATPGEGVPTEGLVAVEQMLLEPAVVVDWLVIEPDGSHVGNETGAVLGYDDEPQ